MSSSQRVTEMEPKLDEGDDIDALLSAAGTFVRDQKTVTSSIIGSHSTVSTSQQLMQGDVVVTSHSQESSVNLTDDPPTSATSNMHYETAAANESLSSHVSADSIVSSNKYLHHSTG